MSWNPKLKVIDTTVLIENLVEFVEANQEAAFLWANPNVGLKNFAAIYNSAEGRVIDKFPSFCVVRDRIETPYKDDILEGTYTVEIEVAIESDLADELTVESRKYRDAIESMLLNIKDALALNSRGKTYCQTLRAETEFDVIGKGVHSKYAQIFTTIAEFKLETVSQ